MSIQAKAAAYSQAANWFPSPSSTDQFTVAYRYRNASTAQATGVVMSHGGYSGDPYNVHAYVRHTGTQIRFGFGDSTATSFIYASYTFTEVPGPHTVVAVFDYSGDTRRLYYDGKDVTGALSDTGSWSTAPSNDSAYSMVLVGRGDNLGLAWMTADLEDICLSTEMWDAQRALRFHRGEEPHRIGKIRRWFEFRETTRPRDRATGETGTWSNWDYPLATRRARIRRDFYHRNETPGGTAGGAELAAATTAEATVTAALTTSIDLASATTAEATATAALTTEIRLAADTTAEATTTAALTTDIVLAAATTAEAAITADLTTAIQLAADAIAEAAASAGLTTGIPLLADAAAVATVTADLGGGSAALDAATASEATVTADLTTAIVLAADATAVAAVTADLTVGMLLAADALAVATATGDLTSQIVLAASTSAEATVTADLLVGALVAAASRQARSRGAAVARSRGAGGITKSR